MAQGKSNPQQGQSQTDSAAQQQAGTQQHSAQPGQPQAQGRAQEQAQTEERASGADSTRTTPRFTDFASI